MYSLCSGSAGGWLCIVYMFRFCWRLVLYSLYVQVLLEAGCVTVYSICSGSAGG